MNYQHNDPFDRKSKFNFNLNVSSQTILTVFFAVCLLLLLNMGLKVATINKAENLVVDYNKALADLNVLENRKVTLYTNMVDAINAGTDKEDEIISHAIELRSEGKPDSVVFSMLAEQYPTLLSITNYSVFMKEMSLTESGIASQRKTINSIASSYEKLFVSWPSSAYLKNYPKVNLPYYYEEVDSDSWKAEWK